MSQEWDEVVNEVERMIPRLDAFREQKGRVMSENEMKTPWQFACDWYQPKKIHRAINRRRNPLILVAMQEMLAVKKPVEEIEAARLQAEHDSVPEDVASMEFAGWLANQCALAMHKGIEIGQRWDSEYQRKDNDPC